MSLKAKVKSLEITGTSWLIFRDLRSPQVAPCDRRCSGRLPVRFHNTGTCSGHGLRSWGVHGAAVRQSHALGNSVCCWIGKCLRCSVKLVLEQKPKVKFKSRMKEIWIHVINGRSILRVLDGPASGSEVGVPTPFTLLPHVHPVCVSHPFSNFPPIP